MMQNVPSSSDNHQRHFPLDVTPVQGRPVLIDGTGGDLTSDAGVLLLRETEAQVGIIAALNNCLSDPRHPSYSVPCATDVAGPTGLPERLRGSRCQ